MPLRRYGWQSPQDWESTPPPPSPREIESPVQLAWKNVGAAALGCPPRVSAASESSTESQDKECQCRRISYHSTALAVAERFVSGHSCVVAQRFVSGHGFSRAIKNSKKIRGFSR